MNIPQTILKQLSYLAISSLVSTVPMALASPMLTLDPVNGAITGLPGQTVGWGFTISNNSDFLVVSSSDFCVGPIMSPCANPLGTYTDFIGPAFIVVGPPPESSSVTQVFDNVLQTGIGSLAINAGASLGALASGEIVLTYDLFSVSPNDPNFNPDTDTVATGLSLLAPTSVSVGTQPGTAPEPATLALFGIGLAGLGFSRRCKRI